MADEREKQEEKEMKIPVFSVPDKGIVLNHIILNSPPHEPIPSNKSHENGDVSNREEKPVIFGRDPDCHIVLDQPSFGRFHLEDRAIPLLQKLSVTDRSSVHGLGPSTRESRLQWVPLSRAFEMENHLFTLLEEKEETRQEDKLDQLMTDLNELWVTEIPSAPPMPEYMNPSPSEVPFSLPVEGVEVTPERRGSMVENSSSFSSVAPLQESLGSSFPREEEIGYLERWHPSLVRPEKRASSLLSRRSKSKTVSFLRIHTGRSRENTSSMISFDAEVEVGVKKENGTLSEGGKHEETICRALPENLSGKEEEKEEEEEETFESDKENMTPKGSISRKLKSRRPDLRIVAAYLNMAEDVFHSDTENWTPEVLRDDEMFCSDKENLTPGVSSSGRKMKERSYKMLQRSSFNTITASNVVEGVFDSDKENTTPKIPREMKPKNLNFEGHMKTEDDEDEEFASDKENLTPHVSFSLKAKEISFKSSARIEREMMRKGADMITFKPLFENPTSRKSRFLNDSQLTSCDGKCTSVNNTQGIRDQMNCCSIQSIDKEREEKKKIWNIVEDTGCFLVKKASTRSKRDSSQGLL